MTMKRERLTWSAAASRKASAPPATPGYGKEDQDHPAHLPDPDMHKYENGDTSSWAEDPKKPPYPQGNPPSTPGYDTEDQDHPAHVDLPRVPKEARAYKAAIQRKANKCVKVAELVMKGKKGVTADMVEDQALDFMDLPDEQLDSMYARLGGGFLAEEEAPESLAAELDELLGGDEPPVEAAKKGEDEPKVALEDVLLAVKKLSDDVQELKAAKKVADQNDPKGPTLAPKPKTEEEARKEAAENDPIIKEFDTYDANKSGFVMAKEWGGSKAVFAALDTDRDGIVARVDLIKMACGCDLAPEAGKKADDLDPETQALLAELEAADEPVPAVDEPAPTACDQVAEAEDDVALFGLDHDPMGLADEPTAAKKSAEDEIIAQLYGVQAAKKGEEDEDEKEAKKGGKKSEDDKPDFLKDKEDEKEAKKAKKSEDEEPKEDEEAKEAKKASVRVATQRPQPKKASTGVKTVGPITKAASNEINELSRLWESAPDVSEHFS